MSSFIPKKIWPLTNIVGFIAQLVEHCTIIAEVMASPLRSEMFSGDPFINNRLDYYHFTAMIIIPYTNTEKLIFDLAIELEACTTFRFVLPMFYQLSHKVNGVKYRLECGNWNVKIWIYRPRCTRKYMKEK